MTGINRQTLFSGTEPAPQHLALDLVHLDAYLRENLAGYQGPIHTEKFRGGQSNPTYKLITEKQTLVLRRKPPGHLLPSAHAIDREFRVVSALHRVGFPVPQPFLYCADESVVGTAFYVVEYVDGRVFWEADMPTVSPAERTSIYDSLNACLAKLHGFNIVDLNLENFGRPGNYMARSLERWSKQYAASKLVEIPDMEWLASALKERLPNVERTSLVHGDYGLYNVIIHPDKPEVRAILDWEVSTLGDPLADLAWHTRPWWDYPDREGGSATSLVSLSLSTLGIPTMDQYVERYCERAGLRSFENRSFYIGYSQFRYAAIMQGIIKRARDGVASNRTMLHTQERVALIAAMARNTLEAG